MANRKIFCNTPWYEAHIYWDGSLGICCQESRKLYDSDQTFNIQNTSLTEWFNSEPVKDFRRKLLSDTPTDVCSRCYIEEQLSGTSRRHRANQKSVIFTRTQFDQSFEQSPGYNHFQLSLEKDGETDTLPIDLHVDLGNYCNLACKMCWPGASSKIATQYVKWGDQSSKQYLGNDWTRDETVWNRFLNELLTIPKLKNVHFMGGETLLTSRLNEFLDFMITHERFDLCFSFVTNGTVFDDVLMEKLSKFSRVGIEVSIETTTKHNDYVRQGTDTELVLSNIKKYQEYCNGSSISITIRPSISALTIGYYHTLLDYCLDNQLLIKSQVVTDPSYLNIKVLPDSIKTKYREPYHLLLEKISNVDIDNEFNESDATNYLKLIKVQINQALKSLEQTSDSDQLKELVEMCKRWDREYNFNAVELYPELKEIFEKYGYQR